MSEQKQKPTPAVDDKTARGRGEGGFDPHPSNKKQRRKALPLEKAVGTGPKSR